MRTIARQQRLPTEQQHATPASFTSVAMDLNVLFAQQVSQLQQCYSDLGHAPQRLQHALQAAIDAEVDRTHREVDDAKMCIEELQRRCQAFKDILCGNGAEAAASSSGTGPRFYEGTYLARIEAWQAEVGRLERQYTVRRAHVDRQIETLEGYRLILADFVPFIEGAASQNSSSTLATPTRHSISTADHGKGSVTPTPIPDLQIVENALVACNKELSRRNELLDADAAEIAQLWAELALLPINDDEVDQHIMQHLRITPRLVDVGGGCFDFCGEFEQMDDDAEGICETPTRKSGSQLQLSGPQLAAHSNSIPPTDSNLERVEARRVQLEAERSQRTEKLQAVYDELVPLWRRFDVADEDVDAFVQANCGCTPPVLEAYESELKQMQELKAQHMALFISKVREDIAGLWDQLMMTPEERNDSFAAFFYDLADLACGDAAGGIEPSDELLAIHEEKVKELGDDLASRERPLELVRQYLRLVEEAAELEASAKDTSRLMGRGAPGQRRDPGRLLREEKMRKRIKFIKPKIEEELMRTIPAWEEEAGRPFVVNGQRFLDTVKIQGPTSPKKRQRTVSQNQPTNAVATPQSTNNKRPNVNGSTQRSASASATASSSGRKAMQPPNSAASRTGAQASQSKLRAPQAVARPQSAAAMAPPTSTIMHKSATPANGDGPNRLVSSTSTLSSHSNSSGNATTVVLGASHRPDVVNAEPKAAAARAGSGALPGKSLNGGHGARPAGPHGTPAHKRPSMLLEASLRSVPRPSSDYTRPSATGAGATLRTIPFKDGAGAEAGQQQQRCDVSDSIGPNWAVLDEDEENLLLL